ncbi:MAG: DUF268 domain-containing protein [Candidatus Shapirobacteria bacterium]|nr:DUF268 domain-containing protein [Candidatus Shapirobacteria bacterium]
MKKIIKKLLKIILSPFILNDYFKFKKEDDKRFILKINDFYPKIRDKTSQTKFDNHYVYHTSWAARKLREIRPEKHIDISSSLYFCGIASAFVPMDFYDYRPANLKLSNLNSKKGDLNNLPFDSGSCESISCMHTVEHIGLGRYGDKINSKGDLLAMHELSRVVKKGGYLIFVVPIGKPKIEFNAHRIYSYDQVLSYFEKFHLEEFSLVTDSGNFIENANPQLVLDQNYGCGMFLFKKIHDNN